MSETHKRHGIPHRLTLSLSLPRSRSRSSPSHPSIPPAHSTCSRQLKSVLGKGTNERGKSYNGFPSVRPSRPSASVRIRICNGVASLGKEGGKKKEERASSFPLPSLPFGAYGTWERAPSYTSFHSFGIQSTASQRPTILGHVSCSAACLDATRHTNRTNLPSPPGQVILSSIHSLPDPFPLPLPPVSPFTRVLPLQS